MPPSHAIISCTSNQATLCTRSPLIQGSCFHVQCHLSETLTQVFVTSGMACGWWFLTVTWWIQHRLQQHCRFQHHFPLHICLMFACLCLYLVYRRNLVDLFLLDLLRNDNVLYKLVGLLSLYFCIVTNFFVVRRKLYCGFFCVLPFDMVCSFVLCALLCRTLNFLYAQTSKVCFQIAPCFVHICPHLPL